jgi:hypothetical protein
MFQLASSAQLLKDETYASNDRDPLGSLEHGRLITMEELGFQRQRLSTNAWALLMFIAYLILGLLVFCYGEGINALDSVYLSVITFTTVGYGKYSSLDSSLK